VPSVRAARYSAGWALLFIALLYTTAPALAVFSRSNLLDSLHGKTVAEVDSLDWATKWHETKLLQYADKNGDGVLTLAPGEAYLRDAQGRFDFERPNPETQNEFYIDNDIIVLSTPEVARMAPWVVALVATGGLAAALSTAAGLLLVISSSIAHDIYYRLINPNATEAKRVLVGRIMIVLAIGVAGYFGINPPGFVAQVVAFAFGLAAASFFPVIILGVFDKRTNRAGAVSGMIVGLGFTATYIYLNKFAGMPAWFGISSEGIGTVGMLLNLAVTLVVSRCTAPPPQEIQDMVESIRSPDHPAPAAILDEESTEFH
jgi:cation/acetate symporter